MLKISQYPLNADGTPMDLEVGVLTNASGNNGARLATPPIGPDNAPIDAKALVLVDSTGNLITDSNIIPVATRAELSTTINPVNNTTRFLTESGREGTFVFSSANLSAQVAADPQQGIYVAPALDTTGASGAWVRKYQGKIKAEWAGLVGDNATDNATALQNLINLRASEQAAGIEFGPGTFRYTVAPTIAGLTMGITISGTGSTTTLKPIGCSAFKFPGNGYYRSKLTNMVITGNSTAGLPCFDTSPTTATNIHSAMEYSALTISGFTYGWKLKNAQLCYFHDLDVDVPSGGAVFQIIPDSGSGQQCNANRAHRVRMTGAGQVAEQTLPTATERATDWVFRECDIQLTGTVRPFHIIDSGWSIERCEFENSAADYLIHLEATGASLAPLNTKITGNLFVGGTTPILSSKAVGAAQVPGYVTISDNKRGSGVLIDGQAGNFFTITNNEGTINDTGLRFVVRSGGKHDSGVIRCINRTGASDAVGGFFGAISSTAVMGSNLAGNTAFTGSATKVVAFARAEPDTSYFVATSHNVNETVWVTNKTTSGFTLNSSNATSTASVDWIIAR